MATSRNRVAWSSGETPWHLHPWALAWPARGRPLAVASRKASSRQAELCARSAVGPTSTRRHPAAGAAGAANARVLLAQGGITEHEGQEAQAKQIIDSDLHSLAPRSAVCARHDDSGRVSLMPHPRLRVRGTTPYPEAPCGYIIALPSESLVEELRAALSRPPPREARWAASWEARASGPTCAPPPRPPPRARAGSRLVPGARRAPRRPPPGRGRAPAPGRACRAPAGWKPQDRRLGIGALGRGPRCAAQPGAWVACAAPGGPGSAPSAPPRRHLSRAARACCRRRCEMAARLRV